MQLHSLGLRTELMFPRFGGEVLDRGKHLVIRTPTNPSYRWGNMLIFPGPPAAGDLQRWDELFVAELGDLSHRVFGWDLEPESGGQEPDQPARLGEIEPFRAAGYRVEESLVLVAEEVHDPPRVNREVSVRPLETDAHWREALELGVLCRDTRFGEAGYRAFLEPKMAMYRRMQEAGRGTWFGAWLEGSLVADLGVFAEGDIARFQSVKTHPGFRRRGVCGTAVAEVARHALDQLGASLLVMLADPEYHAARIYRSIGFAPRERIAGVERA